MGGLASLAILPLAVLVLTACASAGQVTFSISSTATGAACPNDSPCQCAVPRAFQMEVLACQTVTPPTPSQSGTNQPRRGCSQVAANTPVTLEVTGTGISGSLIVNGVAGNPSSVTTNVGTDGKLTFSVYSTESQLGTLAITARAPGPPGPAGGGQDVAYVMFVLSSNYATLERVGGNTGTVKVGDPVSLLSSFTRYQIDSESTAVKALPVESSPAYLTKEQQEIGGVTPTQNGVGCPTDVGHTTTDNTGQALFLYVPTLKDAGQTLEFTSQTRNPTTSGGENTSQRLGLLVEPTLPNDGPPPQVSWQTASGTGTDLDRTLLNEPVTMNVKVNDKNNNPVAYATVRTLVSPPPPPPPGPDVHAVRGLGFVCYAQDLNHCNPPPPPPLPPLPTTRSMPANETVLLVTGEDGVATMTLVSDTPGTAIITVVQVEQGETVVPVNQTFTVTWVEAAVPLVATKIILEPHWAERYVEQTAELTATVLGQGDVPVPDAQVSFFMVGDCLPGPIAKTTTTNSQGRATISVTAAHLGRMTVLATTAGSAAEQTLTATSYVEFFEHHHQHHSHREGYGHPAHPRVEEPEEVWVNPPARSE